MITEVKQSGIIKNIEYSGQAQTSSGKKQNEIPVQSFSQMLDKLRSAETSANITKTGNPVKLTDPRLPGDYISSFKIETPKPTDSKRVAQGMAQNFGKSGNTVYQKQEIDRTSKLYEQCMELESYFVKIMLGSMRKTLSGKTLAGDQSFAGKIYEDMQYDELSRGMTKNAGFGLADQIYLELSNTNK